MLIATTGTLLPAIAESSAALTGLLFVAMSVAPRPDPTTHPAVVQQVRTSAALLAFTSPLAIALFGLVSGQNIGYPATVLGTIGLFFTAAGMRSIVASTHDRNLIRRQAQLIILLLVAFGLELGCGITLIAHVAPTGSLNVLSNVLIASMLIGVARAWEIVGDRPTGLASSIATLAGRPPRNRDAATSVPRRSTSAPPGSSPTADQGECRTSRIESDSSEQSVSGELPT
jgi:hypothetical protein